MEPGRSSGTQPSEGGQTAGRRGSPAPLRSQGSGCRPDTADRHVRRRQGEPRGGGPGSRRVGEGRRPGSSSRGPGCGARARGRHEDTVRNAATRRRRAAAPGEGRHPPRRLDRVGDRCRADRVPHHRSGLPPAARRRLLVRVRDPSARRTRGASFRLFLVAAVVTLMLRTSLAFLGVGEFREPRVRLPRRAAARDHPRRVRHVQRGHRPLRRRPPGASTAPRTRPRRSARTLDRAADRDERRSRARSATPARDRGSRPCDRSRPSRCPCWSPGWRMP